MLVSWPSPTFSNFGMRTPATLSSDALTWHARIQCSMMRPVRWNFHRVHTTCELLPGEVFGMPSLWSASVSL